ncbi:hypothetical protein ACFLZB_03990 [Nanoarchaeota archaeon]
MPEATPLEPMVERHYILPDSTNNLPVVATEIPSELYDMMERMIDIFGESTERKLGDVHDETKYYIFDGSNVFLRKGLAQAGTAVTADNEKGFPMIRLFANSLEEMTALETECGRYNQKTAEGGE